MIVATLFTFWTPANLFSGQLLDTMLLALEDTPIPETISTQVPNTSNKRVGIVSGHWKDNDGAVCIDGLTEEWLNLRIATLVMQNLVKEGYEVDLFAEFDDSLVQYDAMALISIHNDTCDYLGNDATGFKVAPALGNSYPEVVNQLTSCMIERYRTITGLRFQQNKLTPHMTSYHTFNEVHSSTPVIVIETGYMNLDRQILTENTELIAYGVTEGVLCFLQNEIEQPEETTPVQ
ncbi:MAG: N-acetylmuramoyl-L-alanine amidase [Anaerolineaceae bacterium]|nr:N-acetylmuramoyl-L-alanine amidase [Anaerolineaceae bacterium]